LYKYGTFFATVDKTCSVSGQCELTRASLYRPDQTRDPFVATVYTWKPDECSEKQILKLPNVDVGFDAYFENREPAVFHDIKCYKFYNKTDAVYFGDDSKGVFYGVRNNDAYDDLFDVTAETHIPSQFAFDAAAQSSCPAASFKLPDEQVWDKACQQPSLFSDAASSFTTKLVGSAVMMALLVFVMF